VDVALGLVVVAVVLGAAYWRSTRQRKAMETEMGIEPEKKLSKREKKLAEIRANDPDPVIPTFEELVAQEMEDTGVNDISGNEGLADPVKLKVYHRDIENLADCPREALHYRLSYGIEAETATVDDVRLVCDTEAEAGTGEGDRTQDEPAAEDTEEASESST
jgi:hypothetical protein